MDPEDFTLGGLFHFLADLIEPATDWISLQYLNLPGEEIIRSLTGLPQTAQGVSELGLHLELCITPALVPTPAPVLFVGQIAVTKVLAGPTTFEVLRFLCSSSGEFVGMAGAVRCGDKADGIHIAMPPMLCPKLLGKAHHWMGSDRVDIKGKHAVRWMETVFGCNSIPLPTGGVAGMRPAGVTFPSPNGKIVSCEQAGGFLVLTGGQSVLDMEAVWPDALKLLMDQVFEILGGDVFDRFARRLVTNVALDLAMDGEVDAASLGRDIWSAARQVPWDILREAVRERTGRVIDIGGMPDGLFMVGM